MSGAPQDGRRENRQTSDLFGASPCEGAVAVPHGHDGADIFLGGDCHILDESQGSRLATGSAGADRAGEVAALVACRCGRGLRGQRARTLGAELGDEGPGAERVLQGGTQTPVRPPLTRGDHGDLMLGSAVAVGGEPAADRGDVAQTGGDHPHTAWCGGCDRRAVRRRQHQAGHEGGGAQVGGGQGPWGRGGMALRFAAGRAPDWRAYAAAACPAPARSTSVADTPGLEAEWSRWLPKDSFSRRALPQRGQVPYGARAVGRHLRRQA